MSDRSSRRATGEGIAVAAMALLPLLPVLRAPFMYDDTTLIRGNAWMRGWGELLRAWGQPYWPTTGPDALGLYRPLHVALLAATWNATGGSALAFHLYTLALATGAALAVWWLARRGATSGAALAGALLFAAHPLHVEVVASAANASELLVVLFTVLLVRLLRAGDAGGTTPESWGHAAAVGAASAAALLCKESGLLALPLALVTAWGWPAGSGRPALATVVRANRRSLALSAACLLTALVARRAVLGAAIARTSIAAEGMATETLPRVSTMLSLWPRIAASLAWPTSLAPYYGPTVVPVRAGPVALASAALALVALAACVRRARRGERRPLVAIAWIALTYLPASNLLVATGQLISDRTLYGATVGVALLVAWAIDAMRGTARRSAMAVVALLVAHGAVVTAQYATVWTSHRALWSRLMVVEPSEHLGYKLAGMDARARGDRAGAVTLLARANAMAPSDRQVRFEYGQALYDAGRYDAAVAELATLVGDQDVRREPGFVGLYLDAVGRSRGAAAVPDAARPLLDAPAGATAALYAGLALEELGRLRPADSVYVAALRRSPRDSTLRARHEHLEQAMAAR